MGRPLNKHLFGVNANNNIAVKFNNGSGWVEGQIVRQRSNLKFLVKDGSGNTAVCKLVAKADTDLLTGEMSITVKDDSGTAKQVVKISKNLVTVAYPGTNYVTGGTHGTTFNGQAGWSFSNSTSDNKWEIEEAGSNSNLSGAENFEIDVTYPIPGSGAYSTGADALDGISYVDIGTPAAPAGGVTTVAGSIAGLLRSKYNGNFSGSATADISTWTMDWFDSAEKLADVVDTYVSWGQQSDGDVLGQQNFSIEWKGYVKFPVTQKYNLYSESDDENAIWVGTKAVAGITNANYDCWSQNKSMPANATSCDNQNTLDVDSTKWYPIRIWMTEFNGGCKFQLYAQGADGSTLNGSDLQFCHTPTGY